MNMELLNSYLRGFRQLHDPTMPGANYLMFTLDELAMQIRSLQSVIEPATCKNNGDDRVITEMKSIVEFAAKAGSDGWMYWTGLLGPVLEVEARGLLDVRHHFGNTYIRLTKKGREMMGLDTTPAASLQWAKMIDFLNRYGTMAAAMAEAISPTLMAEVADLREEVNAAIREIAETEAQS